MWMWCPHTTINSYSVGQVRRILCAEILRMCGTIFREHTPSVLLDLSWISTSAEILRRLKRVPLLKICESEGISGWKDLASTWITVPKLQVAAVSEGTQVPFVPATGSLLRTGACSPPSPLKTGLQPPLLVPRNEHPLSGLRLFFHGLLNRRWNIKLAENKFQKK